MRLSYIAAFAIATFVGTAIASPMTPLIEKRAVSCKNDNDCPGVTCCNLSTLKCVNDPRGTICDIAPQKARITNRSTKTTKKSTTTTKKPTTTTNTPATTTKKSTTSKTTTTSAAATASYGPLNPPPMNPKPTCRSYTENFTNTVVIEADDWSPQSADVDMINISGSKSAYKVKDGLLTLRMMQPKFDASGKPKTEGVAATLDMAFEMQYGAIEVKMKVSPVNGVCTSVNTMSANGDEIDIEMVPHYFNTQPPSIQEYNYFYRGQVTGPTGASHGGYVNLGYNTSADFHVYRIEWNTDSMIWKTDGKIVHAVNKNATYDGSKYIYPTEPSRIELGIWDAGYKNSGWGGGPIPWHQYKEVNAWFEYVKVECNPIYNHVIPARTASKKSKALSLNANLDAEPPRHLNKTLSNGITIGQHASPGIPATDKNVIIGKVPDAGDNHASPGAVPSQPNKKISPVE